MFKKKLLVAVLSLSLSNLVFTVLVTTNASAQTTGQTTNLAIAVQRGYRTGYSDGYMAGYRDTIDSLGKDVSRHAEYTKADRAFNKDYGTIEDYRDGYQQGFESGYSTGFDKKSFESALPTDIKRRGAAVTTLGTNNVATVIPEQPKVYDTPKNYETPKVVTAVTTTEATVPVTTPQYAFTSTGSNDAVIIIPRETELMLEIQDDLSTERNREGDKFIAKIVSPAEIAGATVEGRINKVTKPGRLKRRSEMSLSFDRILLNDTRWANFSAILTEVMPVKGDNVKVVDTEGTAIGKSSLKNDAAIIGGATTAGLVTGAVIGGPVGAGVGAGVGAAFGVGAVVIQRGKHININKNQQVRIKTSYETQIR